jgi:hypothetical protein
LGLVTLALFAPVVGAQTPDGDWSTFNRTYSGERYSPLKDRFLCCMRQNIPFGICRHCRSGGHTSHCSLEQVGWWQVSIGIGNDSWPTPEERCRRSDRGCSVGCRWLGEKSVSSTLIQPIATYLPGGGWNGGTSPMITYDAIENQWAVPVNLSVCKAVKYGLQTVR